MVSDGSVVSDYPVMINSFFFLSYEESKLLLIELWPNLVALIISKWTIAFPLTH